MPRLIFLTLVKFVTLLPGNLLKNCPTVTISYHCMDDRMMHVVLLDNISCF